MKRFDKTLPLPKYQSEGAVCIDLYVREDKTIKPQEVVLVPLNIAIEMPESCWALVASRGSTHKQGVIMANGIGIVDTDFCGNNDEICYPALNFTKEVVKITKGTRLAQLMVIKAEKIEIEEVDSLDNKDRGSFGSTGMN